MKKIFKTLFLILFLSSYSCHAQQMVMTTDDLPKLKSNEQQFLNKPLKNLIKEIKPEIKTAFGTVVDTPSYFSFIFLTPAELNKKVIGRKSISLYVYLREPFDWDFDKRTKGHEYEWTNDDLEKYGNLTVIRIKVIERIEE